MVIFPYLHKPLNLARMAALALALLFLELVAGATAASGSDLYQAATGSFPPGAANRVKVQVPASMRSGYLAADRYLNVPPGFSAEALARVPGARFMAVAPNGDILVSQPGAGKVTLVRDNGQLFDFVTGLHNPHDIVFHTIGETTYIYISESHQVNRFIYTPGATTAGQRQVVVSGLPDASTPELRGSYGHQLKNIALDSNHKLYVSLGSTCNACLSDTTSNPRRAAIYQYNADGSQPRLFAQGLRNAEGLAFVPGTNDLWVVVNNRDNIAVPDPASPDYGKVIPSYVDNHPPEEFTRVRDGGNYGWPFCNPNSDGPTGYDNMPFDRDVEFNAGGQVDCGAMDRINKGIQAHSAPLGLTFLQTSALPEPYRQGVITALHGSWNRAKKTGYKLAYFPWNKALSLPGAQVDLVTGWLDDATQEVWGRPVDVAVDLQGRLLVSDDYSGTVYRLTYTPPSPENSGPPAIVHPAFERLWLRSDSLVASQQAGRTWLWGPAPFTAGLREEYAGSPGGTRLVQYFDKSRMEINRPEGDQSSPYYVSNGLLARELISGRLQVGDNNFQERLPAGIGVAGDIDDTSGPTYRTFQNYQAPVSNKTGQPLLEAIDRAGNVRSNPAAYQGYNARQAYFVPETGHNIAGPFWEFLNRSGPQLTPTGSLYQGRLFDPLFYATGLPITEPYWARVKVAGVERDVLVQAFERRVLTYTPANPAAFQVEMGNVGRHYYLWRYPAGS